MSNIGKQPILIPEGVEVSRKQACIIVKGKLGELSQEINSDIQIEINDKEVIKIANEAKIVMAFAGIRHFKH